MVELSQCVEQWAKAQQRMHHNHHHSHQDSTSPVIVGWHFTRSRVHVFGGDPTGGVVNALGAAGGERVLAQLDADAVLEEYQVESLAESQIVMVFRGGSLEDVVRVLQKCSSTLTAGAATVGHLGEGAAVQLKSQQQHSIMMRLVKRQNQPMLRFQVKHHHLNHHHSSNHHQAQAVVGVVHEIPCQLVAPDSIQLLHAEPNVGPLRVPLLLPRLEELKTIVDRMKAILGSSGGEQHRLILAANHRGQLNFRVETNAVQVTTYFRNLVHPELVVPEQQQLAPIADPEEEDAFVETVVDIRQFSRFLQCYQARPQDVICCLYGESGLVLHAYLGTKDQGRFGVITYYLAGLSE